MKSTKSKFRRFISALNPFKVRRYDGAAKSRRTHRWYAPNTSANSETMYGLITLRNRSRDLRRNNPYAARAIQGITNNTIGHGIETQFRTAGKDLGANNPVQIMWDAWTQSKDIDYDGRHDIYGLQRLIMDAVVESGEVLIRKRYNAANDFPLQFQVLESDFLDITKNYPIEPNGNHVIQGIEFDPQGRRVAYHLYEAHPGGYDPQYYVTTLKSTRVPAEEVYHIYRQERPGQARGVPWLAPVIMRLKDLDDYEDAHLLRQKIAACFTAFVRDISGEVVDENESDQDMALSERLEPGLIEHLPNGKTIEFTTPPPVTNYKEYLTVLLHGIAAGVGATYEVLTGDLSQVNFSSARMGWLEFQRNIQTWRDGIIIPCFLDPIVEDFKNTAMILGEDPTRLEAQHVPPKREMIDPTKEIPATILALRGGLTTWSDEIMALGKDPADHFAQYKKDLELLDQLDIPLSSDPRVPVAGGPAPAEKDSKDSNDNNDDEEKPNDQTGGKDATQD